MNPKIIAARWALSKLSSDQLPRIALQWLEDGLDSPTLRILAGEINPIMSDVGPMFTDVLDELDISVPTSAQAVAQLVSEIAQRIITEEITLCDGADQIYELSTVYDDDSLIEIPLDIWYLSLEYEDFSSHYTRVYYGEEHCQRVRDELETDMKNEARKLAALT